MDQSLLACLGWREMPYQIPVIAACRSVLFSGHSNTGIGQTKNVMMVSGKRFLMDPTYGSPLARVVAIFTAECPACQQLSPWLGTVPQEDHPSPWWQVNYIFFFYSRRETNSYWSESTYILLPFLPVESWQTPLSEDIRRFRCIGTDNILFFF